MSVDAATQAAINAELERIDNATASIYLLVNTEPPPPPPPPPPIEQFLLTVPAENMRLRNVVNMVVEDDKPGHEGAGSIGFWGAAGETCEFDIQVVTPDDVEDVVSFRYGNGGAVTVARKVTLTRTTGEVVSTEVSFPPTADWGSVEQWGTVTWPVTLPTGRYTVAIECTATGEYLDLDTVQLRSTQAVTVPAQTPPTVPPVPAPPPGTVLVPPTPPAGATVWQVPAQGSLQSVLERARPGDFVYVNGLVASNGYGFQGVNRDNGQQDIVIIGQPGHVLRCGSSGFEAFGSFRGWQLWNLSWEVSGGGYYNSGVSFYGQRTDMGADGAGCARIGIYNMKLRPIAGTGRIQRDGITLWGGDLLTVAYADISGASYNDLGFFGGAGSAISIGDTIRSPLAGSVHPTENIRVWCHHSIVRDQHGPGTDSADRNGINLDNYMKTDRRLVGATLIEDNDIADCDGRGILAAWAGFPDSPILIRRNKVRAPMAQRLGGSFPGGIVAASFNIHGNIEVSDNDVEVSPGYPAYHFSEVVGGVRGSGNKGQPIVGPVPAGFSA